VSATPNPTASQRPRKCYALDQCALFKVGSKKRLAQVLGVGACDLLRLSRDQSNFEIFELEAQVCEFTGVTRKARWVQNPIPELKEVLSRITKLLSRVQVPDFLHGATPGRSYRSNALTHTNAEAVATFDLKDFFPSTTAQQVFRFFYADLQCPPDVASLLSALCTYKGALPTGAPSSPILAYWTNRHLFDTLHQRGRTLNLTMSVYVDDITFSGTSIPRSLQNQVDGIVRSHGHILSAHKTKIFNTGRPKHVTGIVITEGKLRVPHTRFRKARAIRAAYTVATNDEQRARLAAKLCGLLGEAAFLDDRYKKMAKESIKLLAAAKAKLPPKPRSKIGNRSPSANIGYSLIK
jgi:RNA-directed DNA polymerase